MARTSITRQLGLSKAAPKTKWIPRDQWLLEHADEIQATRERNARLRHLGANEYKPGKLGPHYIHGYRAWTLTVDIEDKSEAAVVKRILARRTAYGLGPS